jgi:hypothetical protein
LRLKLSLSQGRAGLRPAGWSRESKKAGNEAIKSWKMHWCADHPTPLVSHNPALVNGTSPSGA